MITKEELRDGLSEEQADRVADLLSRLEHVSDEAITIAGELSLAGYDRERAVRLMDAIHGVALEEIERIMTVHRASGLIKPGIEYVAQQFEMVARMDVDEDVRKLYARFASIVRAWGSKP